MQSLIRLNLFPYADCRTTCMFCNTLVHKPSLFPDQLYITNKDSSIFVLRDNWQKTDPSFFCCFFPLHITKRLPLESQAESCCVKWSSIWLRPQSSLFLPAQWLGTTQAAIYWWQLTDSTGQRTFAHVFSEDFWVAGTHTHTHTHTYIHINMPHRYYSLGYTHTQSYMHTHCLWWIVPDG